MNTSEPFRKTLKAFLKRYERQYKKTAPEAVETIGYGIPSFNLNGRNLVYFAAWKYHISLYPIPSGDEAFQKELSQSVSGKGTTRFPFDKPIPYDCDKNCQIPNEGKFRIVDVIAKY